MGCTHTYQIKGLGTVVFRDPTWLDWERLIKLPGDSGDERLARNLIQKVGDGGPIADGDLPFSVKHWQIVRRIIGKLITPDPAYLEAAKATVERGTTKTATLPSGKVITFRDPTPAEESAARSRQDDTEAGYLAATIAIAKSCLLTVDGAKPGIGPFPLDLLDGRVFIELFASEAYATTDEVEEALGTGKREEG